MSLFSSSSAHLSLSSRALIISFLRLRALRNPSPLARSREAPTKTKKTHRPERLWRVTPLKTDVRDAGPLEFFFSSAACAPPDEVAANDVSTIAVTMTEVDQGSGVGGSSLREDPVGRGKLVRRRGRGFFLHRAEEEAAVISSAAAGLETCVSESFRCTEAPMRAYSSSLRARRHARRRDLKARTRTRCGRRCWRRCR